jgi:hypothetical protein
MNSNVHTATTFVLIILIEFGVPRKLVRLIKMCLNKTYSKIRIGKYLSDAFPIQNGLKQGDAITFNTRIIATWFGRRDGVGGGGGRVTHAYRCSYKPISAYRKVYYINLCKDYAVMLPLDTAFQCTSSMAHQFRI